MTSGLAICKRILNDLAVRLIIGLMLARALVPIGFMPDTSAGAAGALSFTLCIGDRGSAPMKTDQLPAPPSMPQDDGCPYGHLGKTYIMAAVAGEAAPSLVFVLQSQRPFDGNVLTTADVPALGARAPPTVT